MVDGVGWGANRERCLKWRVGGRTATSVAVPLTANILLRGHWRAFDTAF